MVRVGKMLKEQNRLRGAVSLSAALVALGVADEGGCSQRSALATIAVSLVDFRNQGPRI